MNKSKVVVIGCKEYVESDVVAKVKRGIELVEKDLRIFSKDMKVIIKPNLLSKAPVEKAITTNPYVFEGVIEYLKDKEVLDISYGDSPRNG